MLDPRDPSVEAGAEAKGQYPWGLGQATALPPLGGVEGRGITSGQRRPAWRNLAAGHPARTLGPKQQARNSCSIRLSGARWLSPKRSAGIWPLEIFRRMLLSLWSARAAASLTGIRWTSEPIATPIG
jgi:hypothetical protein